MQQSWRRDAAPGMHRRSISACKCCRTSPPQQANAQQARCGLSHKQSPWPGTSAQSTIPAACAAAAKDASRLAAESNACDSSLRGGRHVSADHVEPSQRARLKRLKLQYRSRGDGWTQSVGLARTQTDTSCGSIWHSPIDGGNARVRGHRPHCVGRAVMQVSSSYDQQRRSRRWGREGEGRRDDERGRALARASK